MSGGGRDRPSHGADPAALRRADRTQVQPIGGARRAGAVARAPLRGVVDPAARRHDQERGGTPGARRRGAPRRRGARRQPGGDRRCHTVVGTAVVGTAVVRTVLGRLAGAAPNRAAIGNADLRPVRRDPPRTRRSAGGRRGRLGAGHRAAHRGGAAPHRGRAGGVGARDPRPAGPGGHPGAIRRPIRAPLVPDLVRP